MLLLSLPRARCWILAIVPLIAYLSISSIAAAVECPSTTASCTGTGLDPSIEIEITAYEGVPFVVTYEAEASGWGCYPWSIVRANLEFADLPEGAAITSCNGFGETTVPVQESTWSAVKALYR